MDDAQSYGGRPLENTPGLRTVLIVDDSEVSTAALEHACSAIPGATVVRVSSAIEAVDLVGNRRNSVCAIVTDIHMPRMDGYELIRFIRADPARAAIPIIVVTADPDPDIPGRTAGLGANAYFLKPYSPAAVRRVLEGLLDANRNTQ